MAPAEGTAIAKFTTERFDKAFGFRLTDKKDKDGNPVKEATVLDPKDAEELEKENKFEGSMVTISVDYPATWDGLLELANREYKDEDGNARDINEVKSELVKLFRVGASLKVGNRMRATLTRTDEKGNLTFSDEQLKDGVLDLTDEITSGSKRVYLTEEQKTWRSLSNLPEAVRKQMFDVYMTSIGKTAGVYPAE